jgi:hypothetical protein
MKSESIEETTALALPAELEASTENNYFDCNQLCKKAPRCNSNHRDQLDEIKGALCYVSTFPYYFDPQGNDQYPCRCSYAKFKSSQPYGDPENPYPECTALQKDIPFRLPKDYIITDPKQCWLCYFTHKKEKDEQFKKKYIKQADQFRSQPKVDWGESEGTEPHWHDGYR